MKRTISTSERSSEANARMIRCPIPLFAAALALGGCITVKAPEKPIEINLNVNVRQEVVVRLQKDADAFISNNPELFPQ